MEETITAKEAAVILNVGPRTVLRHVRLGRIRGKYAGIAGTHLTGVYRADVDALKAAQGLPTVQERRAAFAKIAEANRKGGAA